MATSTKSHDESTCFAKGEHSARENTPPFYLSGRFGNLNEDVLNKIMTGEIAVVNTLCIMNFG